MGRPPGCSCHCCDPLPAYVSSTSDPAEPSDPRVHAVIDEQAGEGSLTTENIISSNITASVNVASDNRGASAPGSRRVTINVTSAGPGKWVAGVILWDASGYTYDPSVGGSVSQLFATAGVRYEDELRPLVRDGNTRPVVVFGPVIEQGGSTYLSFASDSVPQPEVTTQLAADNCWRRWSGSAEDGPAPYYIGRTATIAEGRYSGGTAAPSTVTSGGNPSRVARCDDWFSTIDPTDGTLDAESRPDISHDRVSRPITKFGVWIALSGEIPDQPAGSDPGTTAGDYVLDILIDEIYLQLSTWGIHKIAAGDLGSPNVYGTTYVDEPLTSIPAWTQTGLPIIDQDGASEQCWNIANVSLVDGLVGQNSFTGGNEYDAGRIGTSIAISPLTESSQVTVEFTWHSIRDRDHWDSDGTAPDAAESRSVDSGVWFDELFRMHAAREGADAFHNSGNHSWTIHSPPMSDGGKRNRHTVTNIWSGSGDYTLATRESVAFGGGGQLARQRPMNGDRYTIIARRLYTDAEATAINAQIAANIAAGVYTEPPAILIYPEAKWQIWLYSQGRQVLAEDVDPLWATPVLWFPNVSNINLGLIGFCGGRWSDIRVRVS